MGAGQSKTTAEILQEIDREERQIERRRKEVETKIKKSAKEGRVVGFHVLGNF